MANIALRELDRLMTAVDDINNTVRPIRVYSITSEEVTELCDTLDERLEEARAAVACMRNVNIIWRDNGLIP